MTPLLDSSACPPLPPFPPCPPCPPCPPAFPPVHLSHERHREVAPVAGSVPGESRSCPGPGLDRSAARSRVPSDVRPPPLHLRERRHRSQGSDQLRHLRAARLDPQQ